MEIHYSIRNPDIAGMYVEDKDYIVVFLGSISKSCMCDPEENFESFIAEIVITEFHELGHAYGFKDGCKDYEACMFGECFWCNTTKKLKKYILNED